MIDYVIKTPSHLEYRSPKGDGKLCFGFVDTKFFLAIFRLRAILRERKEMETNWIMQIKIEKQAQKYLNLMQSGQRTLIIDGILGLTKQPPEGDIKPLKGFRDGRFRLRVGKYRVIYRYDEDGGITILVIMDIGSRGDIYK